MTVPISETDPYAILKDAVAQHLTLISLIPTDMNGDEALSCVYESAADLDFARQVANDAVEDAAAGTDTGGTSLDLTLEEARLVRALLEHGADMARAGCHNVHGVQLCPDECVALRKRINAGVVRRAEARTNTTDQHFAPRPADAVASSDDEEVAL